MVIKHIVYNSSIIFMKFKTKNNKEVSFRNFEIKDTNLLFSYLQSLSETSKSRFGPHPYDFEAITNFYSKDKTNIGIIGIDIKNSQIIAYSIIKQGQILADFERYKSYQITLSEINDFTYAPSVADEWQSQGLGDAMFKYLKKLLQNTDCERIVLWGGVQKSNEKAVNYYQKNGFKIYGQFENNVDNWDMALNV